VNTPVLFLVFNRPDLTQTVFQSIRSAKPKQLFVAADGPRNHVQHEAELCRRVREIASAVDWDCELHTRFLDENLGCGKAVSSAITWFFDHVEAGIIIEDDCLPDPSFFSLCESTLQRYADDAHVMMVSGDNFQNGVIRGDASYYFSRLAHIWGWATWRRAWRTYDFALSTFPAYKASGGIKEFHPDPNVQQHYMAIFERMFNGEIDTWDFQFQYALIYNNGLSVMPNKNLIMNIGFGEGATHTLDENSSLANLPKHSLSEIKHPSAVLPNAEADDYTFEKVLGINLLRYGRSEESLEKQGLNLST
jgi:hypothetical protein